MQKIWQVFCFISCFFTQSFSQLQYSIPEELKKGSIIGNVARDLGLNAKDLALRKFQMVSQSKKQYFSVNLKNGNIFVSERIDREMLCGIKETCFINLEAVIENPLHFYTVTVEIQDVNDNSPTFTKKYFDIGISESASPGSKFSLGIAQDSDIGSNSVQSYTLSGIELFSLEERFAKDGIKYPEIVLEKVLDREKQNVYELILTAFDGGKPLKSGTAIVRIAVQDVNDNFPVFTQETYNVRIPEDVPIGFTVTHLNATDEDEGSNAVIAYSFSHIPENAQHIFSIDPVHGDITTTGHLDYELFDAYEMTVEAKDGGGHITNCKISIQVVDVNDNAPEITVTSVSVMIPENSPPGTIIALVNVRDVDSGMNGEVVCQILSAMPFQLIPSSSSYYKLVTASNLDQEKKSSYNVTIHCLDNGSPSLSSDKSIQVIISDVNDNPPVFGKMNYIVYIAENNQPGTSIHKVQASDLDHGENGKISYSILNCDIENISVSSYVSINSITGILYAQRSFDYEQLHEFQFQVMAKDGGSPSLNSNVSVRICIIDNNDNTPQILYPSPDAEGSTLFEFIPHTAGKGYLVTKVIAVDADSGHNAWLSYHLLQVPEPSLFNIDQQTGEIRIGRDLPEVDSLRQKIVILVKDNGVPPLSSTVTLNLVVAESFQQVVPEIKRQPRTNSSSNATFYLVIAIGLISILFIVTVMVTIILKCRKTSYPTNLGTYNRNVYPQFTLGCPSEISDTSLPFPFSYDVCVTLDSKQNEIAYLNPVQNVPTDNLIDTGDSASITEDMKENSQSTTLNQVNTNFAFVWI
ncbi:protocadherin gamma-B1-like [Gastrophryne carolinensis]